MLVKVLLLIAAVYLVSVIIGFFSKRVELFTVLGAWIVHSGVLAYRLLYSLEVRPPWIAPFDAALFFSWFIVLAGFYTRVTYKIKEGLSFAAFVSCFWLVRGSTLPGLEIQPLDLAIRNVGFYLFCLFLGIALILLFFVWFSSSHAIVFKLLRRDESSTSASFSYRMLNISFVVLTGVWVLRGVWLYLWRGNYWAWDHVAYALMAVWLGSAFFQYLRRALPRFEDFTLYLQALAFIPLWVLNDWLWRVSFYSQ